MKHQELEYAGFWVRTAAYLIDMALLMLVTFPLLIAIYGWDYFDMDQTRYFEGPADFVVTQIFPSVAILIFWFTKQATPGKMVFSAKIVDASSGKAPSSGQLVGRYFAYTLSVLPLGLGVLWIAFDPKKQGWHDKLAGTVVVKSE